MVLDYIYNFNQSIFQSQLRYYKPMSMRKKIPVSQIKAYFEQNFDVHWGEWADENRFSRQVVCLVLNGHSKGKHGEARRVRRALETEYQACLAEE